MATFQFERELRLTCDWHWSRVHRVTLRPSKISLFMSSQASEDGGSKAKVNITREWGLGP